MASCVMSELHIFLSIAKRCEVVRFRRRGPLRWRMVLSLGIFIEPQPDQVLGVAQC
jgi:hypothetical protein